ncbi:MAG: hypothetical protein Q9213_002957 [Squamulea squamosa]
MNHRSSALIPVRFIKRWFDWHRGYSIITNPDGTEERHTLIGESLSQVDIGYLPRTTEELQAGITLSFNTQNSDTQHIVTGQSSTSAPRLDTDEIDPEDRIFDSSSRSESSHDTESEDEPEYSNSTYQQLLLDLQQNVEDIRANVDRLTRRIPRNRTASQVSAISSNLTSITRSISTIRQNDRHNMDRRITLDNGDTRASESPAPEHMTDDELRRWILQLLTRIQQVQNIDISVRHDMTVIRHLNALNVQLQRAERVRRRRESPAPVFGTLEEVERQGQDYRSVLTTLFTRAVPEQTHPQDQPTITTDPQPQALHQIQRSIDSSGGLSGSEHSGAGRQARELFSGQAGLPTSLASTDGSSPPSTNPYRSHVRRELDFEALIASIIDSPRSSNSDQLSLQDRVPRASIRARPHYRTPADQGPSRIFGNGTTPPSSSPLFDAQARNLTRMEQAGLGGRVPNYLHEDASLPTSPFQLSDMLSQQQPGYETRLDQTGLIDHYPQLAPENRVWTSNRPTLGDLHRQQENIRRHDEDLRRQVETQRHHRQRRRASQPKPSLDSDPTRPEPIAEEKKTITMECKICYQQLSNQDTVACAIGAAFKNFQGRLEILPDLETGTKPVQSVVRESSRLWVLLQEI